MNDNQQTTELSLSSANQEAPLLGLATTRELLTEIAVRMEIGQSDGWLTLADLCRDALELLPENLLAYRTVDTDG